MRIAKRMLINGAILAAVALIFRFVGLSFNVYLGNKLGAEGIGLITLIMSVFGFGVTIATSGINLTTVRLVAEALGQNDGNGDSDASAQKPFNSPPPGAPKPFNSSPQGAQGVRAVMRRCIAYALCFGTAACVLLFCLSGVIGERLLLDTRTVLPLRILALSLPATSLISCISGYFTASRRVYKGAIGSVINQSLHITLVILAFYFLIPNGFFGDSTAASAVIAVIGGGVFAEIVGLIYSVIMYRADLRLHGKNRAATDGASASSTGASPTNTGSTNTGSTNAGLSRKMLGVALPLAVSAYVRSALTTIEHLLIPRGLKRNGASSSAALAAYGTLHGMAFPILFFPAAILSSFTGLIVPEFAESLGRGDEAAISRIASRLTQIALLYSVGIAGVILCFSAPLGISIYGSGEVARHLRLLAPLIPIMYFDTSVDYMLKGLGEQVYCMRVNIIDSALSVLLVLFLIPKLGLLGFIIEVFVCELVNFTLSLGRLIKVVHVRLNLFRNVVLPIFCIAGGASVVCLVRNLTGLPTSEAARNTVLILSITAALMLYTLFLRLTGAWSRADMRWLKGIGKRG